MPQSADQEQFDASTHQMVRLRRARFGVMLSILPASATLTGPLVLAQRPGVRDLLGVAFVVAAVAVHQEPGS